MIPKIIHYCWFGRNPLPESAQKCIASWRKYLPDYEIWQWKEKDNLNHPDLNPNLNPNVNDNLNDNLNGSGSGDVLFDKVLGFDVNIIPYTKQAYEAKKYAFVSDYARYWILYRYGGLYFDTDVEVIKPLDDIIEKGAFMGIEVPSKDGSLPLVAPGLGLGVEAGHEFYRQMLMMYNSLQFVREDGKLDQTTIVSYNTMLLGELGLRATNDVQVVAGITIYPADYFNPLDDLTGKLVITVNTRSIHWYMKSWQQTSGARQWLSRLSHRLFGLRLHQLKMKINNSLKR